MSEVKKKKKHIGLIIALVVLAVIVIVAVSIYSCMSKTFFIKHPELKGEPEVGKWYRVTPETAKSSNGKEWHGILRKGSENKLVVYYRKNEQRRQRVLCRRYDRTGLCGYLGYRQ